MPEIYGIKDKLLHIIFLNQIQLTLHLEMVQVGGAGQIHHNNALRMNAEKRRYLLADPHRMVCAKLQLACNKICNDELIRMGI